jgi:hypothetical protein
MKIGHKWSVRYVRSIRYFESAERAEQFAQALRLKGVTCSVKAVRS